jgi:hypothetical protein
MEGDSGRPAHLRTTLVSRPDADSVAAISRLEARVRNLERLLRQRSAALRLIAHDACPADLKLLSRLASGEKLVPAAVQVPDTDTIELSTADVETVLNELWRSITPRPLVADDLE